MPDLGFAIPEDIPVDREAQRKVAQRIIPAPGRVVLLPIEAANKSEGGLYLPGSEEGKTALAEVISANIGPQTDTNVPVIEVGATVLYQLYQPILYEIEGVKVYVIKQDYIDGVLGAEASA